MEYLKRIKLEGYKSFKKIDLELGKTNVLIGANGVGKSNFVSFFKLLSFMMSESLQEYIGRKGGANSFLYYGKKATTRFSTVLDFETSAGINSYEFTLAEAMDNRMIFTSETVEFKGFNYKGNKNPSPIKLDSGHKETVLIAASKVSDYSTKEKTCRVAINQISNWRLFQFHDTSETSMMRDSHYLDDNRYLRDNGGNLAPYLYMLKKKHEKSYKKIIKTVQRIIPYFGNFELEPLVLDERRNQLDWREKGDDMLFSPPFLSDGSLRFIALTTLLMQPKELLPKLIVIDEPELGLHPKAIRILASMIKAASANVQIILATQSKTLVDEFDVEDVIVMERTADKSGRFESQMNKLNSKDLSGWLEEYKVGELWDKDIIGGRP